MRTTHNKLTQLSHELKEHPSFSNATTFKHSSIDTVRAKTLKVGIKFNVKQYPYDFFCTTDKTNRHFYKLFTFCALYMGQTQPKPK